MDSNQGTIQKVVIKENNRWLDVTEHILNVIPRFRF
jgi:hypothetical protein